MIRAEIQVIFEPAAGQLSCRYTKGQGFISVYCLEKDNPRYEGGVECNEPVGELVHQQAHFIQHQWLTKEAIILFKVWIYVFV